MDGVRRIHRFQKEIQMKHRLSDVDFKGRSHSKGADRKGTHKAHDLQIVRNLRVKSADKADGRKED